MSLQQFEVFTYLFLRGIHSKWDGVLAAPIVVHKHPTEGRQLWMNLHIGKYQI